jgi:hypothetical protein
VVFVETLNARPATAGRTYKAALIAAIAINIMARPAFNSAAFKL